MPNNAKNMLRMVANVIDNHPRNFDMGEWWRFDSDAEAESIVGFDEANEIPYFESDRAADPECGTTGCIAGWTIALLPEDERNTYRSLESVAMLALGISRPLKRALFHSTWMEADHAVHVLRKLHDLTDEQRLSEHPPAHFVGTWERWVEETAANAR